MTDNCIKQMLHDVAKPVYVSEDLLRKFPKGATRSPLGDKLEFEGYLSPAVLLRYAQYMQKHQIQSDGQRRRADNWQNGIPRDSLMDSGLRHVIDWWLYHRGYSSKTQECIEDVLCAVIFNAMAYLKSVMEDRDEN